MDIDKLRKLIRNSKEKLVGLKLRVIANLLTDEIIALRLDEVMKNLDESLELFGGKTIQVLDTVPAQIISTQDKIAQLDEQIEELYRFTFLSGINHSYSPTGIPSLHNAKGLKKLEGALDNLREYRGLLEGDIKKKYTGHPSYNKDLDDNIILEKYKKLKSYRAVGKAMGCDGKTVKERLMRMGYIKKEG